MSKQTLMETIIEHCPVTPKGHERGVCGDCVKMQSEIKEALEPVRKILRLTVKRGPLLKIQHTWEIEDALRKLNKWLGEGRQSDG